MEQAAMFLMYCAGIGFVLGTIGFLIQSIGYYKW